MDAAIIRDANPADAAHLLKIYTHYVENTAISFEHTPPTLAEFQNRMANTAKRYPYLVIEQDGIVQGFAYAGAFRPREAYAWDSELTIYLAPDARGRGLGRALYEALEEVLRQMGVCNLYACIAVPEQEDAYLSANSAQFHAHLGFAKVGEFHNCGYKFGRWYHMIWMEKIIGAHTPQPSPVRAYAVLR